MGPLANFQKTSSITLHKRRFRRWNGIDGVDDGVDPCQDQDLSRRERIPSRTFREGEVRLTDWSGMIMGYKLRKYGSARYLFISSIRIILSPPAGKSVSSLRQG